MNPLIKQCRKDSNIFRKVCWGGSNDDASARNGSYEIIDFHFPSFCGISMYTQLRTVAWVRLFRLSRYIDYNGLFVFADSSVVRVISHCGISQNDNHKRYERPTIQTMRKLFSGVFAHCTGIAVGLRFVLFIKCTLLLHWSEKQV